MESLNIRKGDLVQVITGKDRGITGKVIEVYPESDRIIVEGVNRIKKHTRVGQNARGAKTGGIVTMEAPIHVSNVMIVDPEDGRPTRIGYRREKVEKRRPDGSTTNLPVGLDRFTETDQPGTWWLGEGPAAIPVAVNLDPSESRTAPLSVEQLEKLGVQLDASLSSAAAPTPKPAGIPPALEAESRQKLWRWIITGALAVLLIESLVAGFTARRVSAPVEAT